MFGLLPPLLELLVLPPLVVVRLVVVVGPVERPALLVLLELPLVLLPGLRRPLRSSAIRRFSGWPEALFLVDLAAVASLRVR